MKRIQKIPFVVFFIKIATQVSGILPAPKLELLDHACLHGIAMGFTDTADKKVSLETCQGKVNASDKCPDGGGYFFISNKYK